MYKKVVTSILCAINILLGAESTVSAKHAPEINRTSMYKQSSEYQMYNQVNRKTSSSQRFWDQ